MDSLEKARDKIIEVLRNLKVSEDIPKYYESRFTTGEHLYTDTGLAVVVESVESIDSTYYGFDKIAICKVEHTFNNESSKAKKGDIVKIILPYSRGVGSELYINGSFLEICYVFHTMDSAIDAEKIFNGMKVLCNIYNELGLFDTGLMPVDVSCIVENL